MSTRSMFRFSDAHEAYNVYKHSDGYPQGAVQAVTNAMMFAWDLPRFEPDEFAAGFIAANKHHLLCDVYAQIARAAKAKDQAEQDSGSFASSFNVERVPVNVRLKYFDSQAAGGIRLLGSGQWHIVAPGDIEYVYEVMVADDDLVMDCYQPMGSMQVVTDRKSLCRIHVKEYVGLDWAEIDAKLKEQHPTLYEDM